MTVPSTSNTSAATNALMAGFGIAYFAFVIGIVVLGLVINWQIARKAGFKPAFSLLMLVPLVNFIIILMFAFTRWPVEDERDRLRAAALPHGTLPIVP
jgi:hypothetical protein